LLYEYHVCNQQRSELAPLKKRSPNGERLHTTYKALDVITFEDPMMFPSHSYVLSEDKELVKVTSEGYEYTGMYVED